MSDPVLEARLPGDTGFVNLRGDSSDAGFRDAVEGLLGQDLPAEANTFTEGRHRVYWLGPDEWLIRCAHEDATALCSSLEQAVDGRHVAINDVSGGNVSILLTGEKARFLLARGCTLDLHPRVFPAGRCAQSGLAKAPVLLGLLDAEPVFEIVVRRSFSDYLLRWLRHAGRDCGIVFT